MDIPGRPAALKKNRERVFLGGKGGGREVGTGRKGGRGNYSQDVMCDRRINYKEKS